MINVENLQPNKFITSRRSQIKYRPIYKICHYPSLISTIVSCTKINPFLIIYMKVNFKWLFIIST